MHIVALIVAALMFIPAALAGIIHGLKLCAHHFDRVPAILQHAGAVVAELAPFGTGVIWIVAGSGALIAAAWIIPHVVAGKIR